MAIGPSQQVGIVPTVERSYRGHMPTLHIEHPVTDLATWLAAFGRFEDQRRRAGVLASRVSRPVDRPDYIVVELDFATSVEAESFLAFLRATVWASPANSPALAGEPRTMILDDVA